MKTTLNDYWLIWLSAVRCPKVVHLPDKAGRVGFMILWLILGSGLILALSTVLPPIKVIFLVAWGLSTIIVTYYWVSFLVGISELNRHTCAKLVPAFRRRTIQLFRGTWLILTINASFLIWIGCNFFQKNFSANLYLWIFLCVGTALWQLSVSTMMVGKPVNIRKQMENFFLYFIAIPLVFFIAIMVGMGELLLLVLANDVMLMIYSAFLIRCRFNDFATMFTSTSKADGTDPLIELRQIVQEALATAPTMVPSVGATKEINTNDDADNQRLERRSTFGEKYILKPLTALLLCLDQPRETPRNALCLNLLGLSNQTSKVAGGVHALY